MRTLEQASCVFFWLRGTLSKKLNFSWISSVSSVESNIETLVKARSTNEVSPELVEARPLVLFDDERVPLCDFLRPAAEKVNNKVNNQDDELFEEFYQDFCEAWSPEGDRNVNIKGLTKYQEGILPFPSYLRYNPSCSQEQEKCRRAEARESYIALKEGNSKPKAYSKFKSKPNSPNLQSKTHESCFCSGELCSTSGGQNESRTSRCGNMQPKKVQRRSCKAELAHNLSLLLPLQRNVLDEADTRRKLLVAGGTIERNPGPNVGTATARGSKTPRRRTPAIRVTTYNVRGLGDEAKLRHLINSCYKKASVSDTDAIFFFQETYINGWNKIPYLWRGNYHLTEGNGHRCGCLTLLSSHINIVHSINFEDRGHLLVCQRTGDLRTSYILVNLYAPCPNSQAKIDFFERIFDAISEASITYECQNIIVAGDFNLNFRPNEVRNRAYPPQESRIAKIVAGFGLGLGLRDVWKDKSEFTWRRPNTDTFSTIDRVLFSESTMEIIHVTTEWALSASDHASVEVGLGLKEVDNGGKSKITRLDPSILKNVEGKAKFISEFETMYSCIGEGWNAHLRLEYAKMCIRTIAERIQAERKKQEKVEEEELSEELNLAIDALAGCQNEGEKEELIEYIEELRNRKSVLIDEKGERLAEKLGSKWYNEGEKSNKYFLNILNRRAPDSFKVIINNEGTEVATQEEIEKEIVNFYKALYEDYDRTQLKDVSVDDDFFKNLSPVTALEQDTVTARIRTEDLEKTLSRAKDTAPGPDGIPYSFYKALWRTMGPLMVEAWDYTLMSGNLCPSHKVSFLKLIPKVGMDLKKLTIWRPITLSNCDHKLITKTYADRMSLAVASKLKERQTAYLKGRLINDNVRAILSSINLTNKNEDLDGLIVSLDAKKAFDSVEHSFIKKCLIKFGLENFVPIFEILYSELRSDIIINGRISNGFRTLRGVKQGDALSCILFIMCMEPLLRNVEENPRIEVLQTNELGNIPKVYAYADDVNAIIKNERSSLQELFKEYGRLTEASGLELNADKTEIMHLNHRNQIVGIPIPQAFRIRYAGKSYDLRSCKEVKINGIIFQQSENETIRANVDLVTQKINGILQRWSARHLSILGKILIVKTFAISQVIYLMQSVVLKDEHFKEFNKLFYKFIWNRHYHAAKAPERIKREIVNKPMKYGGLGMLDLSMLDQSLKLRAFARLSESKHPFLSKVFDKMDMSDFFYPKSNFELEGIALRGLKLLGEARRKQIGKDQIGSDKTFVTLLKNAKIENVVNRLGRSSIPYFNLRVRGYRKVNELDARNLNSIKPFIEKQVYTELSKVINLRLPVQVDREWKMLFVKGGRLVNMVKLTSKELRMELVTQDPICEFKLGAHCTRNISLSWGANLTKVTSVRHRNILLRVAHGDVYTKEKLNRFGLSDTPQCPRCGDIETLQHKFLTCDYVKRIWEATFKLTRKLRPFDINEEKANLVLGLTRESEPIILSIHAEILLRILSLKDEDNFLIIPKVMLRLAVELLIRREKVGEIKSRLKDLLSNEESG